METDFPAPYVAKAVAEERIRDRQRERIRLERGIRVTALVNNITKLFR